MTASTILDVLLGAGLVVLGFLASALADHIRGLRTERQQTPHPEEIHPRPRAVVAETRPVVLPAAPRSSPRPPRSEADDVVRALVGAGYRRQLAVEAVARCDDAARATIEGWTRAALRYCARGDAS